MKSLILNLTILLSSFSLISQDINGCDGQRYIEDIFEDVTVTEDLMYGSGITYAGNPQDLFLDVYEPTGDDVEARPVVILAFGGSFINGTRKDIDWLCEAYARKGYVAVSVDYRVFDGNLFPFPDAAVMTRVVIKATSDMKAAVRYMRESAANGNTFNIDSDNIMIGGISSGGIAACHAAALDTTDNIAANILEVLSEEGGIEGNSSDNKEYSSAVSAIINYSGGLNMANWLDENDPPIFSVHDEFDDVVPYAGGFAKVFGVPIIFMEGSARLSEVADSVGVTNELITIEDSQVHVSYLFSDDEQLASIVRSSSVFMNNEVLCPSFTSNIEDTKLTSINVYPNPTSGLISLDNVYDIKVYNAMGQVTATAANTNTLDISNQSEGIYFLHTTTENGKSQVTKVILNK